MSGTDEWSPDEALDASDDFEADAPDRDEGQQSLDRQIVVDQTELEEAGAQLDDPESLAVLGGGMDDPDGVGGAGDGSTRLEEAGWDLDAEDG